MIPGYSTANMFGAKFSAVTSQIKGSIETGPKGGYGKVISITFSNTGTNSVLIVQIPNGERAIQAGQEWVFTQPFGFYDLTFYRWYFTNGPAPGTVVNNVLVTIQSISEDDKY